MNNFQLASKKNHVLQNGNFFLLFLFFAFTAHFKQVR